MKRLHDTVCTLCGLLLFSCGQQYEPELIAIDSMADASPDSAAVLLSKFDTLNVSEGNRMYYYLLRPVLCDTRTVLNRISLEDLAALVNEPVADDADILEIDTADDMMVTDEDIRRFLFQTYNIHNPLEMQNMSKEFRNVIIKAAKEYGGSIRQLSRLTGLSYGLIRKVS